MAWARRATKPIPRTGSSESIYQFDDYSLGMNSHTSNDKLPNKSGGPNFWRLAQNARMPVYGEYETRQGVDFHSAAVGETEDDTEISTTGAADQSFNTINRIAQKFTAGATQRLSKVEVRIKNASSAVGTVAIQIYSDSSGAPGTLLAKSTIDSSDVTSSYQYLTARFIEAPTITSAANYWIVLYVQANSTNSYSVSSTTNSTDALTSTDSGNTWSAAAWSINYKQHYATSGEVKGFIRSYKSDGTALTIFAHGTAIYSVNESTGALTTLKSGLSASATHYRFIIVNDIIYYVNGFDGLRKLSGTGFATEAQVSATNYTHIALHKGLLFLVEKDDPNKMVYSNFAEYETFTSTDFIYIPAPKTGDPTTAVVPLNGNLLLFTKNNKYILSGDDNATFVLDEAPDQKGTYTQETTTVDKNFVYYLSNDGVYMSNGSEAKLLSKNNYEEVLKIQNRDTACMEINKGRLYLWYRLESAAENNQCYVWNMNYEDYPVESLDTKAYIRHSMTAFNDDNQLMVGSSLIGQVYWQELESNDYDNLGGDIEWLLQGHYNPYGAPASLKEIRYWNPRFEASSSSYPINYEYAYDLRDNWTTYDTMDVQGAGETYGGGAEFGDGSVYGSTAEFQSQLYVPGEYRRIAIRYKHFAARQPQKFLGHTLAVQTRRMR